MADENRQNPDSGRITESDTNASDSFSSTSSSLTNQIIPDKRGFNLKTVFFPSLLIISVFLIGVSAFFSFRVNRQFPTQESMKSPTPASSRNGFASLKGKVKEITSTSTPTPRSVVMRTPTTVATPTSTPPRRLSSNFACTMVIGYSQVGISPTFISGYGEGWYVAPNYTLNFEKIVGNDTWQLLWDSGHGVDQWQNPNAEGWSKWRNREHPFFDSACTVNSATPDRIIFSISAGYGSDEDAWRRNIEAAITTIIGQIPSVKQLVLQPVVGGPNHETCPCTPQMENTITGCSYGPNVRASWQHTHIDNAIAILLQDVRSGAINPGREIISGYSPEVRSCNDYLDGIGHLTTDGADAVGKSIGQYYAD